MPDTTDDNTHPQCSVHHGSYAKSLVPALGKPTFVGVHKWDTPPIWRALYMQIAKTGEQKGDRPAFYNFSTRRVRA
ncbi:hypothetical protein SJAG_01904 [Schizosaccharomyces japonicus yFS275]|uniref:Uncharacterized protein n=1 Tax=Schizosaccharomyces japonicus (strain yFS275 / FY16936) TaxID=402676 RepID=B6JZ78_SCHJY|nr:hypothetical protein SJAG_01904 [Schizosaccharomyces japonicus yFS275]EEB06846.1 hypothetical protein SJAG_01904 [Schizosaccharomyces japonicus yFS275]